jgi:hypothetical protein
LLKELATVLAGPLTVFFRKTLNERTLPSDRKEAQVTPSLKKGDKSSPGNYRPASLTSVVCKLMECVVRDRIIDHLTAHISYQIVNVALLLVDPAPLTYYLR